MINHTKVYWDKLKEELEAIELYSYIETRDLLLEGELYKRYIGKAKNRTFIKEHPKLYKSVLEHTTELEELFTNQKTYKTAYNLTHRLKFITELDRDISKLKCECGRKYNWSQYCRKCPDPKRNQLGKPHTEETKRKMRVSTLAYLTKCKGQLAPRYNIDSIKVIEEYGRKNGYKFMHAENGGEFFVEHLGYFLDGYDPISNVALEVDEKHHFDKTGELCSKDTTRQKQIEKKLGCTFIRVKYDRN